MTPVLLRSLKMLSLCFGLVITVSGCLGSGDDECRYNFGSYRVAAHELGTTCGVSPQLTRIELKKGTNQIVGRNGVQATTEVYSLGCELRLRHDERSIVVEGGKESIIDGIIQPLSGPNVLEGWATFERKNPDGSLKCTGEYYLVLTNIENVSQKTKDNREN